MKYDVVVIGGGLSGLSCALRLQRGGKKCALVSTGESSLYFSSGTMGLYNAEEPFEAIAKLPADHPYSKIGIDKVKEYASGMQNFFAQSGVTLGGSPERNSWRLSPAGNMARCFMAMDGVTTFPTATPDLGKNILIVNFLGFLDFNTAFIAEALEKNGAKCTVKAVQLPELERLRTSATEMRPANIARVLDREEVMTKFIGEVKKFAGGFSTVVLPAVFGLSREGCADKVARGIGLNTIFVGTMPPSAAGIRTQMTLSKAFQALGGRQFTGDTVVGGIWDGPTLKAVKTVNMEDIPIAADQFVLASGSFFSKGLTATPDCIYEGALGLDVDYPSDRAAWYDLSFFARQNYIGFGVKTDSSFRAYKGGELCPNVYAAGSILSGANTLEEGSGAGVAVMSAFAVADEILGGADVR